MLKELDNRKRSCKNSTPTIDMVNMLRTFSEYPRLHSNENILRFWHNNKNNMPELYSLAEVALSVPPTQVSVERLFSTLKYILSLLRYNLSDDIFNDILILRANAENIH